jgi:radical SAM superfamily enzyme YgiQ (UPF0313 family)
MRVALVACYELGHQPLHVATPAAKLRERGHDVRCLDLSVQPWDDELVAWAEHMAFSVPMHTATRIARRAIEEVRASRSDLPVACYGLYAGTTADTADCAIAGEADGELIAWVEGHDPAGVVHLGLEAAQGGQPVPARDLLPALEGYARLARDGAEQTVGYVEASHGCAHRCRHCPVPVVYDGRIRIVNHDAVLADAAQQIEAGARHITFGDPDFLNGAAHARRVVRALHDRFPAVTFDCTVKVEHVLRHEEIWEEFAEAGCIFVVSAFECVDDETLIRLDKNHTSADAARAVDVLRRNGIEVRPSWMPFTPWTTIDDVRALLDFVADHDLVANVDPVQYTIRLLLPEGSLLLDHPDLAPHLGSYDAAAASYTWTAADPAMDALATSLSALVEGRQAAGDDIIQVYDAIREACGLTPVRTDPATIAARPRLTESWFCCAEPTAAQMVSFGPAEPQSAM